jgi:four helix bundle protein
VQSAEYRVQRQSGRGRAKPAFFGLLVWERAQALADRIATVVDGLARGRSLEVLANQVTRSASSVPANIAEGYGRYSEPAYRSFLSIARGSLYETESTLDLMRRRGHISEEVCESLIQDAEEVARLITATMKPLRSAARIAVREEGPEYEV